MLKALTHTLIMFQFTHPGRGATYLLPHLFRNQDKFQFTHPGRGATDSIFSVRFDGTVSIHAPREGCDLKLDLSQR